MPTTYLTLNDHSIRRSSAATASADIVEPMVMEEIDRAHLPPEVVSAPVLPITLLEPVEADTDGPDHIETNAGKTAWGIVAVGADRSRYTGAGVKVAVIDTGIDTDHPAFEGVTIKQANFVGPDNDAGDHHGHGTHCAGTIFGRTANGVRIGVAPGITDVLIAKVFAPGVAATTLQLGEAINWAVREGADIISMSLGMDFPGYVESLVENAGYNIRQATSMALKAHADNVEYFGRLADSIRAAQSHGQPVTIVAAAGNESVRGAANPIVLFSSPPATANGVMAVGALARSSSPGLHQVAPFSNTDVVCSAPGVNVLSAALGGGLRSLSGTSMATPHVAGLLALHIEKLRAESGGDPTAAELAGARLTAGADTSALVEGWAWRDYGSGLSQAP